MLSTVSSYDYSDSESSSSSEEYEDNYGPDDIAEYHYDDFSEDLEYGGGGQHAAGGEGWMNSILIQNVLNFGNNIFIILVI